MKDFIQKKITALPQFSADICEILNIFEKSNDDIIFALTDSNYKSEILNLANNHFLQKNAIFKELKDALNFYGKEEVKAFFLFAVFRKMLPNELTNYKIDAKNFTEISLLRNALMFEWIQNFENVNAEILSTTILIEFSRIFIDELITNLGVEISFYDEIKHCIFPTDFTDVEQKFTGVNREIVAALLFKHFGLDKIALYAKFSSIIDDADEGIKKECAMIKIVKTAVNIYHRLDERSIDNTLNLLDEHIFEQDAFVRSIKKLNL